MSDYSRSLLLAFDSRANHLRDKTISQDDSSRIVSIVQEVVMALLAAEMLARLRLDKRQYDKGMIEARKEGGRFSGADE